MSRLPVDRFWPVEAIGDRTSAWVRAALYEGYGARPGGWWVRSLVGCVGVAIAVAIVGFTDGYRADSTTRAGLEFLWRSLAGEQAFAFGRSAGRPPYGSISAFAAIGLVGAQVTVRDLHAGLLQPLGRAARARVSWGLALVANLGQALLLAIVLSLLTELLRRGLGGPAPHFAYLRALSVAVVILPALQAALTRTFPAGSGGRSMVVNLSTVGVLSMAFLVALMLLVRACEALEGAIGVPPVLAAGLLAFALGQLALRAWLTRWYARCDLV